MPVDRRRFLTLLGAGITLTACAPAPHRPASAPTTAAPPPIGTKTPAPTTVPAPSSMVSQTSKAPAALDRAAIIARHSGRPTKHWGTHLAGIHTHVPAGGAERHLALTFDGCGGRAGSGVDHALLELLEREKIPATMFLNRRWIDSNLDLTRHLAANPLHEIGNHGTRHVPLSVRGRAAYGIAGTASVPEVVEEVLDNHERIRSVTGRAPRWFRSGTAHYDDVAAAIVADVGEQIAGFATNGDAGATFSAKQVRAALLGADPGAIVLMHLNQPSGGTAEGLATALPELRSAGTTFVHLGDGR